MISRLGLSDCVRLVGFVPDDVLPMMYAAADAFVLPTAELECFGIIALESLACGRPVLATPVGAIPEILQQVEPRWLTRDASPGAIAERLVDFLKGDLPVASPESLRSLVVQNYSYDTVIEQLVETAMGELPPVEEHGAK
jgi:glycosyltransferase involved in cell wall biosynthesis